MSSNIKVTNVTKLTTANAFVWEKAIIGQFQRERVLRWVQGNKVKPQPAPPDATDQAKQDAIEAIEAWEDTDALATGIMLQSVSNDFLHLVDVNKTSSENWKALLAATANKSASHIKTLKRALEQLTPKSSETLLDYHLRWSNEYHKITAAGGVLTSLEQVEYFLSSLPDQEYKSFKDQFDTSEMIPTSTVDSTLVKNPLTLEYVVSRMKARATLSSKKEDTAMFTNDKNHAQKTESKWNNALVCYNCGGYGHTSKSCASPKRPRFASLEGCRNSLISYF